jgi:hypothetical protein
MEESNPRYNHFRLVWVVLNHVAVRAQDFALPYLIKNPPPRITLGHLGHVHKLTVQVMKLQCPIVGKPTANTGERFLILKELLHIGPLALSLNLSSSLGVLLMPFPIVLSNLFNRLRHVSPGAGCKTRTCDLVFTKHQLWPTELIRQ